MQYYVLSHDGQKYGPSDLETLQQWVNENRILPDTQLEESDTGNKIAASSISELKFSAPGARPISSVYSTQQTQPMAAVGQADPANPSNPVPLYGPGSMPQETYGVPFGASALIENTSGMNGDVPLPISTYKWNWGSFFLNWIWLMNHGLKAAGLAWLLIAWSIDLVAYIFGKALQTPFLYPLVANFILLIYLGVSIYLGLNGHSIAWKNRRYQSIDQYLQVETAWMRWAIGIFIASFILGILLSLLIVIGAVMAASSHP